MNEARIRELADYIYELPHVQVAEDAELNDLETVWTAVGLGLTGFNLSVHVCGR